MSLFSKVFSTNKSELRIRYSKSQDEWHVYRDMSIVYMGTKEKCQEFMRNSQLATA